MRAVVVCMLGAALAVPALASGYSEYTAGMNANARSDYDQAISHFTSALTASDLVPDYVPSAHVGRGIAYLRSEQCTLALSDFNEALKTQSWSAQVVAQRARANACLGKFDEGLADAAQAISLRPEDSALYGVRGRIAFDAGRFATVAADFEQSLKLDSKNAATLLWLGTVQQRLGTFDERTFGARVADADTGDWPRPLFDLLRGRLKDETRVAKAIVEEPNTAAFRQCQWNFFSGEWHLAHGDVATAKTLLKSAAATCPRELALKRSARLELARLPQ